MSASTSTWHVLQLSGVVDLEFASALAESVPVILWEPDRSLLPMHPGFRKTGRKHPDSSLQICSFPLLRGFARFPFSLLARTGPALAARLAENTTRPEQSPLICTTPYFASVSEAWHGPVVYWLTDLIAAYDGASRPAVKRLDERMCRAATLVCPNSERLARYLIEEAGCDPGKVHIVPNATRKANLLPEPPLHPSPLPQELAHLSRPVAGVIGNLSGNMNWPMLERLLVLTPDFSWAFVGSTAMPIADGDQCRARESVMRNVRACFTGQRPYRELVKYARALDVAVLPYLRKEPTFSGSSTRYYEHLAACRPMIAFPGVQELLSKPPLLQLSDTAEEAASILDELRAKDFDDDLTLQRWKASRNETWQMRAASMQNALKLRCGF